MWHPLQFITQSRFLNEASFVEFAHQRAEEFGLEIRTDRPSSRVSTWHVDALVAAFRAADTPDLQPPRAPITLTSFGEANTTAVGVTICPR